MVQTTEILLQQENIKTRLLLLPNLFNKRGNINSNIKKLLYECELDILNQIYPGFSPGVQVYCTVNNIPLQHCIECNSPSSYFADKKFSEFCSLQCSRKNAKSIDKRANTKLAKYGTAGFNNKPKAIQSNLIKYGVTNPTKLDSIKTKISNTLKQNYAESYDSIIAKKEHTFQTRYGMHPNLTEEIQAKKRNDTMAKYGVNHTTQLPDVIHKIRSKQIETYELMHDKHAKILRSFATANMSQTKLATIIDVSLLACHRLLIHYDIPYKELHIGSSAVEENIANYIMSVVGEHNVVLNNRTILAGKELDIYIPTYNLAIEVNGIYWHCEKFKHKNYHLEKTMGCKHKNIQLLHIFDSEWNNPTLQKIWKSMIKSRLLLNNKIHARKCIVKSVSTKECKEFLNINHLSGFRGGHTKLGLYYKNTLVQVIVVGKSRFNKKYDNELIRAATAQGTTVQGGLSKLLSKIQGNLISYADIRYSSGAGYDAIGMTYMHSSKPNYYYLINGMQLQSRIKYQKHKLANILKEYDPVATEAENMYNNGYYRVWDCGNLVYSRSENNNGV